jgi:hypothetical protein
MKKVLLVLTACAAGLLLVACSPSASAPSQGSVKHVVCFKFKDAASKEQIQKVVDDFRALKTKIPAIVSFETGTNISPEKLNKGITHCFLLSFKNEADRDVYLKHVDHEAFAKGLGPVLEDVFVIDYQATP